MEGKKGNEEKIERQKESEGEGKAQKIKMVKSTYHGFDALFVFGKGLLDRDAVTLVEQELVAKHDLAKPGRMKFHARKPKRKQLQP